MRIKMNQLIQWSPEILKTPRQMVDEGLAIIEECPHFYGPRRTRGAVFVQSQWGEVEVSGYVKAQPK